MVGGSRRVKAAAPLSLARGVHAHSGNKAIDISCRSPSTQPALKSAPNRPSLLCFNAVVLLMENEARPEKPVRWLHCSRDPPWRP